MRKKLIDKDVLVAEIERRIAAYRKNFDKMDIKIARILTDGKIEILKDILSFLDTIEVKEVDLEKEATEIVQSKEFVEGKESPILLIAKHFFELGLKIKEE